MLRFRFFAKTKQTKYINIIDFLIIGVNMRNNIAERFHLLQKLGGLPEPEVINEEWLYILKEETRNSILIEGFFVSEEELEEVLASGNPLKRNQEEGVCCYRVGCLLFGFSYENYRSK